MEMPSSVWSSCFLLLALLFVINMHEQTPRRFFHYCSGCLLSKAEKYQQTLCLLSLFSVWMQIPFNIPDSRKSLTVSPKTYFFWRQQNTDTTVTYSKSSIVLAEMIQHKNYYSQMKYWDTDFYIHRSSCKSALVSETRSMKSSSMQLWRMHFPSL